MKIKKGQKVFTSVTSKRVYKEGDECPDELVPKGKDGVTKSSFSDVSDKEKSKG